MQALYTLLKKPSSLGRTRGSGQQLSCSRMQSGPHPEILQQWWTYLGASSCCLEDWMHQRSAWMTPGSLTPSRRPSPSDLQTEHCMFVMSEPSQSHTPQMVEPCNPVTRYKGAYVSHREHCCLQVILDRAEDRPRPSESALRTLPGSHGQPGVLVRWRDQHRWHAVAGNTITTSPTCSTLNLIFKLQR